MPEERKCKHCHKTKPIGKFRPLRRNSPYRRRICTACYGKVYWQRHKDKLNVQRSQYRKNNPAQAIYSDTRAVDRKKGRANDLTKEFIAESISKGCSYCGEASIRMSLDRIDNSKGHTVDNVVPACIRCNTIRGSMPYDAWLRIAPAIRKTRKAGLFGSWVGRRFPARVVE